MLAGYERLLKEKSKGTIAYKTTTVYLETCSSELLVLISWKSCKNIVLETVLYFQKTMWPDDISLDLPVFLPWLNVSLLFN